MYWFSGFFHTNFMTPSERFPTRYDTHLTCAPPQAKWQPGAIAKPTSSAMALTYTTSCQQLDWQQLAQLLTVTGLGTRSAQELELTFRNSQVTVFAHQGDQLVGAGRALSDHVAWSVVFDVAIDPALQGQGVGAALIERIQAAAGTPNIMLKSMPGKEGFYTRLGYQLMPGGMERRSNSDAPAQT